MRKHVEQAERGGWRGKRIGWRCWLGWRDAYADAYTYTYTYTYTHNSAYACRSSGSK
jgi:hypothetical protein